MPLDPPQEKIARYRRAFLMANGKRCPRIFWNGQKYVWPVGDPMSSRTSAEFEELTRTLIQRAKAVNATRKN